MPDCRCSTLLALWAETREGDCPTAPSGVEFHQRPVGLAPDEMRAVPGRQRRRAVEIVVSQIVQIVGALLVLAGYVLAQFRYLDPRSYIYLFLNAIGSAILAVLAIDERQWGFLLL